jgi:nucleotide-binding universal stress UspA family protein
VSVRAIVVGTDGSNGAERAVRRAVEVAKGSGARLHLVTAYPDAPSLREPLGGSAKTDAVDLQGAAENVLARGARLAESEGLQVDTEAHQGDPAHVILEVAERVGADLIVVGARGLTGIERFLLGSVSSKLSHHASRDVMIVRDA